MNLTLCGKVATAPVMHHEKYGSKIMVFELAVSRQSGTDDIISVMVSEKLLFDSFSEGDIAKVSGEIRTYKSISSKGNRLMVYAYAYSVEKKDDIEDCTCNNHVVFEGIICSKPEGKTTKSGRKISSVMVAVKRNYDRVSYVPSICWGINSLFADRLAKDDKVKITGRLQSRAGSKRMYYEVSVQDIVKV
jgi:hypothetical protein